MSRFRNVHTGVVFSVADHKDDRYSGDGHEKLPAAAEKPTRKTPSRKAPEK